MDERQIGRRQRAGDAQRVNPADGGIVVADHVLPVAGAPDVGVVAGGAGERVIAGAAGQDVVAVAAGKRI
ncbi:MAG TPA: hypothetical protein DIT03_09495, partial [Candidatus Accumulibacter sp.]|nr:hypothetical protein [Accumulibacter sp.]